VVLLLTIVEMVARLAHVTTAVAVVVVEITQFLNQYHKLMQVLQGVVQGNVNRNGVIVVLLLTIVETVVRLAHVTTAVAVAVVGITQSQFLNQSQNQSQYRKLMQVLQGVVQENVNRNGVIVVLRLTIVEMVARLAHVTTAVAVVVGITQSQFLKLSQITVVVARSQILPKPPIITQQEGTEVVEIPFKTVTLLLPCQQGT